MKKSISIVLSLLMVFSCFTCLLTSTAQAASVSAWTELWHQGYEDSAVGDNLKVSQEVAKTGALPSAERPGLEWGVNAAAGYFGYASADAIDATKFNYRNNTMTVTDAEAASGEKSVAIMAGMFAFSTSLGNLTPNTNYKVAVKLKGYSEIAELGYPAIYVAKTLFEKNLANDPGKQQSVCLKDSAGNYARIQNYTYKTDSFDTVELEFNSGDCETAYLVLAFNNGPTGVAGKNLWVDDLSLSTLQDVEDINAIGTFEGIKSGTSLKVSKANAEAGALPDIGEWGWNSNAGYFDRILARETTLVDGTTYTPAAAGGFSYRPDATVVVSNEKAHSGSNSLRVANAYGMVSVGLNVKKNTDYKLTYYCMVTNSSIKFKRHGIYSDLQISFISNGSVNDTNSGTQNSQRIAEAANTLDVANTTDWQKVEVNFNSGNLEKVYYAFAFDGAQVVFIDDLALKEVAAPTSFGDLEDFAAGTSLKVKDITKFPENGEWGASKIAGYFGATYEGTNYDKYNNAHAVTATGISGDNAAASFKTEDSGDAAHGNVLRVAHTAWVASMGVAVEKNTNYILSYDIKYAAGAKLKGGSFISTAVNTRKLDEIGEEFKLAVYNLSNADSESWTSVSAAFNSGNLEKVYLVMNDRNGSKGEYYLDNITLTKVSNDSITTFGGASIRTTGNPALRFKSTIDVAAVGTATGATVSEFGFTAIRSDYLGTAELVKDGVYGSKKAVTGVAYQAGGEDNKILEQDGNKYTFRAALYNIGVNKDGSRFDYSILGKEFSVRTYVVLQHNGGTREVLYGETQSYSIFEVAKFLEDNKATYESDWNAVNSYLNAADQTADINNVANRAAAYAAWKENGSGYTGDIDQ